MNHRRLRQAATRGQGGFQHVLHDAAFCGRRGRFVVTSGGWGCRQGLRRRTDVDRAESLHQNRYGEQAGSQFRRMGEFPSHMVMVSKTWGWGDKERLLVSFHPKCRTAREPTY